MSRFLIMWDGHLQGVLSFCKAEAVMAGYLRSTKMEKEQLVERKNMQALQLFEQANQVMRCHQPLTINP